MVKLRCRYLHYRDWVLIAVTTIEEDIIIYSIITQIFNCLLIVFCIKIQIGIARNKSITIDYNYYTSYRMSSNVKQLYGATCL